VKFPKPNTEAEINEIRNVAAHDPFRIVYYHKLDEDVRVGWTYSTANDFILTPRNMYQGCLRLQLEFPREVEGYAREMLIDLVVSKSRGIWE